MQILYLNTCEINLSNISFCESDSAKFRYLEWCWTLEITQNISWCDTNVSYAQAYGCRKRGRNLKISTKKAVFWSSSNKKQGSPVLASRTKTFGKIHLWPPWKKSFRRPCTQVCKMTPFLWKIVLYYTIWQHCSTTPMRQAIHSKATDCAWCILPNNYESCRITNVRNNIDKILPIVCNVFFIERFTLSLDPILIVFLKLAVSRQKSGWPAPPEMKVGY